MFVPLFAQIIRPSAWCVWIGQSRFVESPKHFVTGTFFDLFCERKYEKRIDCHSQGVGTGRFQIIFQVFQQQCDKSELLDPFIQTQWAGADWEQGRICVDRESDFG